MIEFTDTERERLIQLGVYAAQIDDIAANCHARPEWIEEALKNARCCGCGELLSMDLGIALVMDDKGRHDLYCEPCNPDRGRGYTLSQLKQMREESQVSRAAYEMQLMDKVGPDVYFTIKGRPDTDL
jgi:hypothetical protein